MGTLFDQQPRNYFAVGEDQLVRLAHTIRYVQEESPIDLTIEQILRMKEVLELERQNDLMVANHDVLDEQLAGFGDILKDFVLALSCFIDAYKEAQQ